MLVVTCTGGERGDILNPALQGDPEIAARHRRGPPARDGARRRRDPRRGAQAGSASSTPACPRATRCRRCPRAASAWSRSRRPPSRWCGSIREFRPHVMTTYDENGGYPHPDHIMSHKISVEAFDAAGDPDRYPGAGEPWQPLKLYYDRGFSRPRDHGLPRGDARRGARVAVRGVAGALGRRRRSDDGRDAEPRPEPW